MLLSIQLFVVCLCGRAWVFSLEYLCTRTVRTFVLTIQARLSAIFGKARCLKSKDLHQRNLFQRQRRSLRLAAKNKKKEKEKKELTNRRQ